MKINFENINNYVRKFEDEKDLLDFVKEKLDFLNRNNKNYNASQYVVIQDLKEIFDNIEIEEEEKNERS